MNIGEGLRRLFRIMLIVAVAALFGMATWRGILSKPRSAERQLQQAAAHGLRGKFASAIALATEVIDRQPSHAVAYVVRGTAHRRAGEYTQAIADLDRALELNSQIADACTQRAFAHQQSDMQDVSRRVLVDANRAIELDSSNPLAFIVRGNQHSILDDHEAAISDFDEALRLNPASYSALANRAASNVFLERLPEARRDLQRALDLNPPAEDRAQIVALLRTIAE